MTTKNFLDFFHLFSLDTEFLVKFCISQACVIQGNGGRIFYSFFARYFMTVSPTTENLVQPKNEILEIRQRVILLACFSSNHLQTHKLVVQIEVVKIFFQFTDERELTRLSAENSCKP